MESGASATTMEVAPVQQGSDPVAFGKHAELTYDELWAKEPGYCYWTIKKFKELVNEGVELEVQFQEGDSKMKRLAQWLIEREKQAELNGPAYEYDKHGDLVEIPTSLTLKERVDAAAAEKGPKFYGIAAPEKRVCTSWGECKKYVHGVKGVMYRSFPTREEAEEYIANPPARKTRPAAKKQPEGGGADGDAPAKTASEPKKKSRRRKKSESEDGDENAKDKTDAAHTTAPSKKKRKVKDAAIKDAAKPDAKAEDEIKAETKPAKAKAAAKVKAAAKGKAKAKANAKGTAGKKSMGKANVLTNTALAKLKAESQAKIQAYKAKELARLKAQAKARVKASNAGNDDNVAKPSAEELKNKQPTKAADGGIDKINKAPKETVTKTKKEDTPVLIAAGVMQQAESLGFAASLRNLASRPEIMSAKLPGYKLLEALKACDGLVNKAKTALLEPRVSTPSKATSQEAAPAEDATPEKEYKIHDALSSNIKEKGTSSQASPKKNVPEAELAGILADDQKVVDNKPSMTEEQRHRIQENRERALAKKQRVLQEQSGGA